MIILAFMFFLHVIDDFILQPIGFLAKGKQKDWWRREVTHDDPKSIYKYDYIVCLLMHGFSWSFLIMLPLLLAFNGEVKPIFIYFLLGNTIIHAILDDLKANRKKINLIQDQLFHFSQICLTYGIYVKY